MPKKVVEVAVVEALIDGKVEAAFEKAAKYRRDGKEAKALDYEARASAMLAVKQGLKFCPQFDME